MRLSPRIVAIKCIEQWRKKQTFIEETLQSFFEQEETSHFLPLDRHFAYELGLGTARNWNLIISYITDELQVKLPKEDKKLACLAVSIYQRLFHQSIQDAAHALVYEYVEIAKYLSGRLDPFYKFLNAILRKSLTTPSKILLDPPTANDIEKNPKKVKTFFSISDSLFQALQESYSKDPETFFQILTASQKPLPTFARGDFDYQSGTFSIQKLLDISSLDMTSLYIQNITQPKLFEEILRAMNKEEKLLDLKGKLKAIDLCAAPGGKSVMCWQTLTPSTFVVNEPSLKRHHKLKENLERFHIKATITSYDGTQFPLPSENDLFDLAIIDAPCSNTGVLYKCPEAKYRLTSDAIKEHVLLQQALLDHASKLTRKGGYIWYMTCSILKDENSNQITWAQENLPLTGLFHSTILPDGKEFEGGFASLFKKY